MSVSLTIPDELVEQIAQRAAELLAERETPLASWLDADGAAKHLATSRDRIYDLVQLGKLEPHRDGRRLLFRQSDLDAYLEAA